MIMPSVPEASMRGVKASTPLTMPQKLTSSSCLQPARFSHGLPGLSPMPALFISSETGPKASKAASASRPTSSGFDTSVATIIAPPFPATAETASAARSRRVPPISASTTFMPIAAKRRAAANPMPEAAPVMTATLPGASAGSRDWISASFMADGLLVRTKASAAEDLIPQGANAARSNRRGGMAAPREPIPPQDI